MPLYHITCAACGTPFSHTGYSTRRLCDYCQKRRKTENAARRGAAFYQRKKRLPDFLEKNREAMRRWRDKNPERQKAIQRSSYARHREANKAKMRARYSANRDRARVANHGYYLAHRQEALEQVKGWRENNRDRARSSGRKATAERRARLAGVTFEAVDRDFIIKRDRGICGICSKKIQPGKETLDHIVPIFLGGPHTASNLRIAHDSCNKSRGPGRTPGQPWLL